MQLSGRMGDDLTGTFPKEVMAMNRSSGTSGLFAADVKDRGRGFTIVLIGDLDISTRDELNAAVDRCLRFDPQFLHLDCRQLTFVSWIGIEALLRAVARSRARGTNPQVSQGSKVNYLLNAAGFTDLHEVEELSGVRGGPIR